MIDSETCPGNTPIELRRFGPDTAPKSVLLIHGASANSDTFRYPNGGLVAFLQARDWDVWTLDWRGSSRVVKSVLSEAPRPSHEAEYRRFTLDHAAAEDIPWAIQRIKATIGERPLSALAHCFGSAACAIAIAAGHAEQVHSVVLSTLGLFIEVPWDGWIKAEDFVLERVLANAPECRRINPHHFDEWPEDMRRAYGIFPGSWLPAGDSEADRVLQHLTFMFGQPYPPQVLAPGIHGPLLRDLFGDMHLGLYLHAGQLVRRGYAARFDAPDVVDWARAGRGDTRGRPCLPRERLVPGHYLDPTHFRGKRITLITGAQNRLWHRDSIDLMHEWLLAEAAGRASDPRPVKHVLPGFAHQDLLWGRESARVYPLLEAGLQPG